MALILKDRVKETCTGTNGNFTFAGAVSGYVAFSTVGNSNTTYYAIEDADGTKWEVGLGTLNADSSEIARTTVLSNQAGNTTTQTFSGGTHTIYCVYPADKSVHVGANIDIGSFSFTAETLVSDVSTGTAPITVSSTTKVTNLNADKLDDEEGSYYLDFGNFVIDDDEIPIAKLASDSVSFGGITVALGASDATPAFNLSDATNYPTSSLSGTITNAQLAGSIANAKLVNDGITIAGADTSLGGSITADTIAGQISVNTIAFTQIADLARGSILYGNGSAATAELTKGSANTVLQSDGTDISWATVTNAMLAGSIANAKLANDSVSYGGVSLDLGGTDATLAFDLADATNYPTSSLSGTITNAQLAGSIANAKLANSTITVAVGSDNTAISLGGTMTFAGTTNEVEVSESSGTVTIGLPNNVTIAGNLTVNGTTTTVNSTTLSVADPLIILASGNNAADSVDIGFYGLYDTSGSQDLYAGLFRDANDAGKFKLFKDLQDAPTTTVNTSGTGYAVATLVTNIEGDVTGDLTGNADTVTNGVYTTSKISVLAATSSSELAGVISDETGSGALVFANSPTLVTPALGTPSALVATNASGTAANLTAGTATVATTVTVADESSDTTCFPLFVTAATGDLGPKLGSNLTFNSSTGVLTATGFAGPLTGNVTGNVSGTAATVTTAAQGNITSLGTLTTLTVDDIAIDGKVITMTGSSDDTAVFTVGTHGTLSIVTTDTAASAANIQITADGTVDIDSAGVLTLDSGAAINIEPASGSAILLDGTISIDAGVVTGATSITSTVFVGNVTGNVTGNTSGSSGSCTGNSATATLASTITVTDSTSNTDFPVVFHDESNALLDDTGVFEYNPSTGTVTATVFSGSGASLTSLNGSNISSGTVAAARVATLNQDTAGTAAIATTVTVADESSDTTCFPLFVTGDTGNLAPKSGSNLTFNSSSGVLTAAGFAGPLTGNVTGNTSGSSGSCTGNAATATALASAVNIGGTSFDGTSSIVPGTITVADTTDTSSFVALFESATGNLAPKTDAGITYNAGTGTLTATAFAGPLTGNVTGNASGTALTVTQAAQTAITSLGTLTALTVDDVAIDGKVITMTGSTDDTAVFTVGTNGTLSIVTTDNAAAAANIEITADGTVDINSAGVLTLDSGAAINIEPADGSAILLDGTISIDAGVVTGATSITSTVFVGDVTGDVSGTAATVTGAAQTAITSLGTLTALTVDDVAVDGKVITMTGSANDTAVFTVGTNGTLSIVTTDTAAAAANVEITADGTVDINSAGVLTLDSGAAINIEPATGSAILLDGTISIDAGVVTGATSITSTAFVGDLTGNADTVTVTDSNSNTDFPVVFHDESNALLDDTAAFEYNPSTGTITLTGAVIDFNGTTGNNKLDLVDNIANGLDIVTGGSDSYMKFNTQTAGTEVTYSKEAVEISKPLKCSKAIHSSISKTNAVATSQSLKGGGTGNVVTLDLASAGFFRVQLTANVDEIWFKNQAEGQKVIIRFEQDGTGSRLVDFAEFYATDGTAVSVNFPGGTAPTLTTTASKADVIGFLNFGIPAGSVHYYNAVVIGQNFS